MDEVEKLKAENEKLKEKNLVKSDLISISAHQLRTSLTAEKWTLKMFVDGDLGKLTDEQKSFIEKVSGTNEQMIILVNDLLALNHADDTTITLNFKKVNLPELIDKTLLEFSGETSKKNISVTFKTPEADIPEVNCDREMMRVVFQNLIENAIKYSKPHDSVSIDLEYAKDSNALQIKVHDNGIGIDEEDKCKIFDKFFRADNATKKEALGSGLGLFTTKNIVERHKGKIWFESSPKSGTTFFITLPIS